MSHSHFGRPRRLARPLLATPEASSSPSPGPVSVWRVTLLYVQGSAEAVAQGPGENIRVARAEFGVVWVLAQQVATPPGPDDDYVIGVLRACRWLADQPVPSILRDRVAEMPRTPLTRRLQRPMPETIDAELLAAYTRPGPRRDLARGVAATLE